MNHVDREINLEIVGVAETLFGWLPVQGDDSAASFQHILVSETQQRCKDTLLGVYQKRSAAKSADQSGSARRQGHDVR